MKTAPCIETPPSRASCLRGRRVLAGLLGAVSLALAAVAPLNAYARVCAPNETAVGGQCLTEPLAVVCDPGFHVLENGKTCVPDAKTCAPEQVAMAGLCGPPINPATCPAGTHQFRGRCVQDEGACAPSETRAGDACIPTGPAPVCDPGQHIDIDRCVSDAPQ